MLYRGSTGAEDGVSMGFFLLKKPVWFVDAGLRLLWNVNR